MLDSRLGKCEQICSEDSSCTQTVGTQVTSQVVQHTSEYHHHHHHHNYHHRHHHHHHHDDHHHHDHHHHDHHHHHHDHHYHHHYGHIINKPDFSDTKRVWLSKKKMQLP